MLIFIVLTNSCRIQIRNRLMKIIILLKHYRYYRLNNSHFNWNIKQTDSMKKKKNSTEFHYFQTCDRRVVYLVNSHNSQEIVTQIESISIKPYLRVTYDLKCISSSINVLWLHNHINRFAKNRTKFVTHTHFMFETNIFELHVRIFIGENIVNFNKIRS